MYSLSLPQRYLTAGTVNDQPTDVHRIVTPKSQDLIIMVADLSHVVFSLLGAKRRKHKNTTK
jgi:hypothetical protein